MKTKRISAKKTDWQMFHFVGKEFAGPLALMGISRYVQETDHTMVRSSWLGKSSLMETILVSTRHILESFVSYNKRDVYNCQSAGIDYYLTPPYSCSYSHGWLGHFSLCIFLTLPFSVAAWRIFVIGSFYGTRDYSHYQHH